MEKKDAAPPREEMALLAGRRMVKAAARDNIADYYLCCCRLQVSFYVRLSKNKGSVPQRHIILDLFCVLTIFWTFLDDGRTDDGRNKTLFGHSRIYDELSSSQERKCTNIIICYSSLQSFCPKESEVLIITAECCAPLLAYLIW